MLVLFFSLEINVSAQSISDIKKQKAKTEKEIAYLNSLLKEAEKNKSVSTQKLNILRQKIQQSKKLLSSLNQEVGLIQNNISANEQRIKELEENKKSMLDLYAKLVYGSWKKRNKTDKLMFIFSSADFNQAYNRFKYFQQIQEYSKRQLHMIQSTIEEFYETYDSIAENCEAIIVDETDVVFNNDVVNAAICPVVTLRVEIDCEKHTHKFLVYE